MKPKTSSRTGHGLAALTASLLIMGSALAADKTWNGSGDGSTMTSSNNWVGAVAPVANDSLFFDGGTGLGPYNDFAAATVFAGLTFNGGAGEFSLSGNEINLAGGVTNLSANLQTLTLNLNQTGSRTHVAVGNLAYNSAIKNNALIKRGAGTITLGSGLDNSNLRAEVYDGLLVLAKTGNRALGSSPIVVSETGGLRIAGPGTDQIHFNQRVVVTNGGVFQIQNTFEEIGALSGSNSLTGIVENGLVSTTNRLDIGGGSGHEGIFSGLIRDGAGVLNLRVYRHDNKNAFNGTHTYTGTTEVQNNSGVGISRLILNGSHVGGGAYTISSTQPAFNNGAALCGTGVISATVMNFNNASFLSPGGGLSADMTDSATFTESTGILTISNAVNLNSATASLDVQVTGPTPGTTYDQVVIAGSGTISNNNANLKLTLGYAPAPGDKITLVQVAGTSSDRTMGTFGSLNGVATSMAQGATIVDPDTGQTFRISYRAEGSTFDMGAGNGNDIMLEAITPTGGAALTWRGDAGPDWDVTTTANWRTTGGVASTFNNSDFVTFDNSGSNSVPLNLVGDLNPATVLVNATNNYQFDGAGKLTGLVILTKTNTGKLTMTTDNDNVGATLFRQGTIQIGTNGMSGKLSGNINMRTNTTLIFSRSDAATYAGVISGAGTVINNSTNGAIILTADSSFSGGVQANAGTLQFGDGTGVSGSIAARVTNNATVAYNFNNAVTINNSLSGTGNVNLVTTSVSSRRYTFPSTLQNSGFSGTFNVGPLVNLGTADGSSGTNQLGVGSTVFVEDTGSVLLDRFGVYRTTFYLQGAGNGAGNASTPVCLELEQGSTITSNVYVLSSTSIGGFLGDVRISGRLLDTNGTSTITFANGRANATSFNLQLGSASGPNHWGETIIDPDILNGEIVRVTAMTANAISTNGLTIGAHGVLALNGNHHTVGNLKSSSVDGTFLPSVLNNSATIPAVLTVGADDTSTTFDGVFGNGNTAALGLTKVGAGTFILSGNSTMTGSLTVAAGAVALSTDGSFSNATRIAINSGAGLDVTGRSDTSLNLQAGQTLLGNGTLSGNLVALPGSVINPGASIGTLNVANDATLGGTLLLEVDRNAVIKADRLNVTGTLTAGGTLAVTNLGAALQPNDTFALFSTGVGGFAVSLPAYDLLNAVSYTWQNDVAANGSVKVLTVAPIGQPVLTNGVSGNNLNFSWNGPFKLQAQTNSLSVGINNNWNDYPGGGTSPVSVSINPTNPTVFFRLKLLSP